MSLRERKKLAVWRSIQAAALELFDSNGFDATTVEQIAAAANISRATFFNYFTSKEAVVFDQDPEERSAWYNLMHERPAEEALWDALTAVFLGFNESLRARMPLQRRLKAQSPALAQSAQAFGQQFSSDLRDWVASRSAEPLAMDDLLQLNLALAAASTAYQSWRTDESFDEYLLRLDECLARSRPMPGRSR